MKRWLKVIILIVALLAALVILGTLLFPAQLAAIGIRLERPQIETTDQGVRAKPLGNDELVGIVAKGLRVPTGIAFMPEGGMLVIERFGNLRIMHDIGTSAATNVAIPVGGVHAEGDGGLLGIAVHPNFNANKWIYLYTTVESEGRITNRVDRYVLDGQMLGERTTIIQGIPGGGGNNGGALAFGPDRKLYVGTGVGDESTPDLNGFGGKILRLNDNGSVPSDNPSTSVVWASGFHNVRGVTWDGTGQMWATDTGRSGLLAGLDEINQVQASKDYGWPNSVGDESDPGQEKPYVHSGPFESWVPAGAVWLRPALLFAGLRGDALFELNTDSNPEKKVIAHFLRQFGHLRSVVLGPNHSIYVTTSNDDGLGTPSDGDDMILSINPRILGR